MSNDEILSKLSYLIHMLELRQYDTRMFIYELKEIKEELNK